MPINCPWLYGDGCPSGMHLLWGRGQCVMGLSMVLQETMFPSALSWPTGEQRSSTPARGMGDLCRRHGYCRKLAQNQRWQPPSLWSAPTPTSPAVLATPDTDTCASPGPGHAQGTDHAVCLSLTCACLEWCGYQELLCSTPEKPGGSAGCGVPGWQVASGEATAGSFQVAPCPVLMQGAPSHLPSGGS